MSNSLDHLTDSNQNIGSAFPCNQQGGEKIVALSTNGMYLVKRVWFQGKGRDMGKSGKYCGTKVAWTREAACLVLPWIIASVITYLMACCIDWPTFATFGLNGPLNGAVERMSNGASHGHANTNGSDATAGGSANSSGGDSLSARTTPAATAAAPIPTPRTWQEDALLLVTDDTDSEPGRDEALAQVEVGLLGALLALTVLGNAAVLLALRALRRRKRRRRKQSRMLYFIMHLSVADMVTAALSVLPQLLWKLTFRFRGGNVLCKLVKFGQPLGVYLSSYVLTATALDRYHAICRPLQYCSWAAGRARALVAVAWAAALLFCLPQLFIFSYQRISGDVSDCWAQFDHEWGQRAYVTWYCVSVFLSPLAVLLFTYSRICITIWRSAATGRHSACLPAATPITINNIRRSSPAPVLVCPAGDLCTHSEHAYAYRWFGRPTRRLGTNTSSLPASAMTTLPGGGGGGATGGLQLPPLAMPAVLPSGNPLISRAKINTIKQTVAVIAIYILCSAPFVCVQLWAAWAPATAFVSEPGPFHTILTLLFSLNSCVNPWIYLAFNRELMRALWMLVSCTDCGRGRGRGRRRGSGGVGAGDATAGLNDIRVGLSAGDNDGADGVCMRNDVGVLSGSGSGVGGADGGAVSLSVSSGGRRHSHRTIFAELAGSFRRSVSGANAYSTPSRHSSSSSQINSTRDGVVAMELLPKSVPKSRKSSYR